MHVRRGPAIVVLLALVLLVLGAWYLYQRAAGVAETMREVALEEGERDTLALAGVAASLVGQAMLSELQLTPEQEATVARLHEEERDIARYRQTQRGRTAYSGPNVALRELVESRQRAIRDSVRGALTEEQRKKLEASVSLRSIAGKDWSEYAQTPFAQELLAELDLTALQKQHLKALARGYAPRLAALLAAADPPGRRARLESLFDEAWGRASSVLTPEQQARVDRFLRTHRAAIEAGLRGVWLQGL